MHRHLALLRAAIILAALTGCGGGGGSAPATRQTGQATFNIVWPDTAAAHVHARVFPDNAQSIRITIFSDAAHTSTSELADKIIPRSPTPQLVTMDNLPQGTLYYVILALPNADGTGTPLAQATSPFTVPQAQPVVVNLGATVNSLDVQAANAVTALILAPGDQMILVATPKDKNGNVVPVPPAALTWNWSSDQTAVAAVAVPNTLDPEIAVVTAGQ